ncbi:hypothetical protein L7F22_030189 [Adiantum nelumboides]|nr:hypothetical protein [Adiantum nelumboides]
MTEIQETITDEVPFEVLVRRQIARLLDPSLQCVRFIYDELVKISHRCESHEMQRFPVLRRRIEEVMSGFLREGLAPAETMICHLIEMEMDYINTSHPAFISGNKAVEVATHHIRSTKTSVPKDSLEWKESPVSAAGQGPKSRAFLARNPAVADNGLKSASTRTESSMSSGGSTVQSKAAANAGGNWGISSIFGGNDARMNIKDSSSHKASSETVPNWDSTYASIQLKQPPSVLKAADVLTDQELIEIAVTRLLIKSYYDIVRKNIQDAVPKAVMHFLVNHTKRELHSVFIRKLYREHLFEEMLQEREDVAIRRKRCKEVLRVLQQAVYTLEELPLDYEASSTRSSLTDAMGLPPLLAKSSGIPYQVMANGDAHENQNAAFMSSPKTSKSRKSGLSGEIPSSFNNSYTVDVNGPGDAGVAYPSIFA